MTINEYNTEDTTEDDDEHINMIFQTMTSKKLKTATRSMMLKAETTKIMMKYNIEG